MKKVMLCAVAAVGLIGAGWAEKPLIYPVDVYELNAASGDDCDLVYENEPRTTVMLEPALTARPPFGERTIAWDSYVALLPIGDSAQVYSLAQFQLGRTYRWAIGSDNPISSVLDDPAELIIIGDVEHGEYPIFIEFSNGTCLFTGSGAFEMVD